MSDILELFKKSNKFDSPDEAMSLGLRYVSSIRPDELAQQSVARFSFREFIRLLVRHKSWDTLVRIFADETKILACDKWLINLASIGLQRFGHFKENLRLLSVYKQHNGPDELIDFRLMEAKECMSKEPRSTYFRRTDFDQLCQSDGHERVLLDSTQGIHRMAASVETPFSGDDWPTYWPKKLNILPPQGYVFHHVTVFSDCSVWEKNASILHYEDVKSVQASWQFTFPRCNERFTQWAPDDPWVLLDTRAENQMLLADAYLVPNPVEGVGHFIHDALPALEFYDRYRETSGAPTIVMRKLRDYDRAVIEHILVKYFTPARIVELNPGDSVAVEALHGAYSPFVPRNAGLSVQAVRSVRRRFCEHQTSRTDGSQRKLWISRGDGVNKDSRDVFDRALRNSGILEKSGFMIVELSQLSPEGQLDLFASATHIAGVHGAGLMNLLFSGSESVKVTEILAKPWTYYTIAAFSLALGFDYVCFDPDTLLCDENFLESSSAFERLIARLSAE